MDDQPRCTSGLYRKSDSRQQVTDLIERLFSAADVDSPSLWRDKRVFIKPDLSCSPDSKSRTDPEFLCALVEYLLATGASHVIIGDSPLEKYPSALPATVARVASSDAVRTINLNAGPSSPHAVEQFVYYIADSVLTADLVINLAAARRDRLSAYWECIANLFSVVPGYQKERLLLYAPYRDHFARIAVDLLSIVKPSVNIVAAPVEFDDGEAGRHVMLSDDAVALDSVMCSRLGIRPQAVRAIRLASESGLGIGWPDVIAVDTVAFATGRFKYNLEKANSRPSRLPAATLDALSPFIWARPRLDKNRCLEKCRDCAAACPTRAIAAASDNHLVIHHDLCIACWRCREICPTDAISEERSFLSRWLP